MKRKGFEISITLLLTIVVGIIVIGILGLLISSRADSFAQFGLKNANLSFGGVLK
ncbi:MAG: hypothetical protein ABEJ69_00875 [Candidatus Nanohaloarchaea archaeon]